MHISSKRWSCYVYVPFAPTSLSWFEGRERVYRCLCVLVPVYESQWRHCRLGDGEEEERRAKHSHPSDTDTQAGGEVIRFVSRESEAGNLGVSRKIPPPLIPLSSRMQQTLPDFSGFSLFFWLRETENHCRSQATHALANMRLVMCYVFPSLADDPDGRRQAQA